MNTIHGAAPKRLALVVGGSGGIGRAICLRLVGLGIDVVATGAHQDKLASLAAEAARRGSPGGTVPGTIRPVQVRASRPEEILAALPEDLEPDSLVCSFGPVLYRPVGETSLEEWRSLSEMNLVLPGALVSRYLPGMRQRSFGRILLFGVVGSDGVKGYREIGAYGAVKTALSVMVRSLALEIQGTGIAVSAILPTYVDTEYLSEAERRRYARRNRENQLQKPDEIAKSACYLITSEDNRHNGAVVPPRFEGDR